jgi:subtilisin
VLALQQRVTGARVVRVHYYEPAVVRRHVSALAQSRVPPGNPIKLRVVSAKHGKAVVGAFVVGFVDYSTRSGDQGVTDAHGDVALALGGQSIQLDRLYVYPARGYWSLMVPGLTAANGVRVKVEALDLAGTDGLRHYYPHAAAGDGTGVTVGVIDTGVGPHPDQVVAGGANTVAGEKARDYGDNGRHHGTHVAGIIAARGEPPHGVRGVAPGVTLRAYRVFAKGSGSASNFAIAKAIDQAVADGCDLLNMSLGGGRPDDVLTAAIQAARDGGSLCIIAAGNSNRSPVAFPASNPMALAVSALGRIGTLPATSAEADDVAGPYGIDKADCIASFSNVGPEIDLTAPGVGILSTVPRGYAEMSGTSMACPAATGRAARMLTSSPTLDTKSDARRSAALTAAILGTAKSLGFGGDLEGHGVLR